MATTSPHSLDALPQPVEERPLTIADAITLVLQCLQCDQVDDAGVLCRKILEVAPDHPDATHYLGVVAHKQGRTEEGLALMRRSLELAPAQADWHSNVGILLQSQDDLEGAIECFERALALEPLHANAHGNLGVLLRVLGRHAEAEAEYRRTIELDPNHADAYQNLAILLSLTGRSAEAVTAYCKALTLRPEMPEARRLLSLAYTAIGDREKAIIVCEEWVKAEPDDPAARHALAAVSGREVPPRAPDDYVRQTFDKFSTTFEAKLAKLQYRAPELVVAVVAETGAVRDGSCDVLDLGCGTGLCGPLLRPYASRLVGVDLSIGMLKHAQDKRVYDQLVQAELTEYAGRWSQAFDIVVSADTLVYFGALDAALAAMARALRPGGWLVFTVEEAAPSNPDAFSIQPHGRYNHRADYVEQVLDAAGFDSQIGRAELRKEQGLPVAGLIVRARARARAEAGGHRG